MKTKRTFLLVISIMSLFMACSVSKARVSKFSSVSVPMGTDKSEVMTKFGSPYKSGYFKDDKEILHEDWYYKESLYLDGWLEVTHILHFENGKVVSIEPLPEKRPYLEREVEVKPVEKKP